MRQLVDSGYQGPVFLGSAKADGKVMHLGDWSEVLWSPINKIPNLVSLRYPRVAHENSQDIPS